MKATLSVRSRSLARSTVVAGALLCALTPMQARSNDAARCDERYFEQGVGMGLQQEVPEVIRRVRALEPECAGTGVYEARLSLLYTLAGEYEKARALVTTPVGDPKYKPLVEFALIMAEHYRGLRTLEEAQALEAACERFVARYPVQVPEAWGQLGAIQAMRGQCEKARGSLERLDTESATVTPILHRLAICYLQIGREPEAVKMGNKAFGLDKRIDRYPRFACAWAIAYARVGEPEAARTLLEMLAIKRPDFVDNELYKAAQEELEVAEGKRPPNPNPIWK